MMGICRNLRNIPNVLKLFLLLRGADIIRNFALLCPNLPPKCKAGISYSMGTLIAMHFFLEILCVQGQWGGQQLFQEKQFQLKAKYLRCGPTVISFVLIFEEKKENIILQMNCHLFDIFVNMFPLALLVEVNDPSKPSHCWSKGPWPSKTIETNG